MRFTKTHPSFQRSISAIATVANLSPEAVFLIWERYSKSCHDGDQSPILGEFVRWHAADLGADPLALEDALTFSQP